MAVQKTLKIDQKKMRFQMSSKGPRIERLVWY